MEIKIEKGVKISAYRKTKYPFLNMEPGESFFVKMDALPPSGAAGLRALAHRHKTPKRRFKVAQLEDGVRVWRVK